MGKEQGVVRGQPKSSSQVTEKVDSVKQTLSEPGPGCEVKESHDG